MTRVLGFSLIWGIYEVDLRSHELCAVAPGHRQFMAVHGSASLVHLIMEEAIIILIQRVINIQAEM